MKMKATKEGHHYILNGRKMWITNGNINGGMYKLECFHSILWYKGFLTMQNSGILSLSTR